MDLRTVSQFHDHSPPGITKSWAQLSTQGLEAINFTTSYDPPQILYIECFTFCFYHLWYLKIMLDFVTIILNSYLPAPSST